MSDFASFNIRDFGAIGDGRHDDTAAIQKALDKAAGTRASVFVPDGVFLSSTIKIPPHVGLIGNPTWSFRHDGGSIIRLGDPSAKCLVDLTGAIGATLNGLCLDGASLAAAGSDGGIHGIFVDKKDSGDQEDTPRIERCRVNHFTGDGVRLTHIWCFSIRSCMFSHNKGDGLSVRGWDGFIMDNWFSGNGGAGYAAREDNASMTMTGNRIEWNAGGGIVIHGGSHYNITGNYIDRSGGAGITLMPRGGRPAHVITITGNVIFRSGAPMWRKLEDLESTHLRFEGVRGLVCTGNAMRVWRNDGDSGGEFSPNFGIVVKGLVNSVIKDNTLDYGAMKELLVDLGGHDDATVVRDNPGCLFVDNHWKDWD